MPAELIGELSTLLTSVAYAHEPSRRFLRVTGSDATRWLNGMVTNSIQATEPGAGTYNFVLNAQGRIQADCLICRDPASNSPEFLIATTADQAEGLMQLLDRFIIMDDVELIPAYEDESSLELVGPEVANTLERLGLPQVGPLQMVHACPDGTLLLTAYPTVGVPRVGIRGSAAALEQIEAALQAAFVPLVTESTLEQLRVLEARPRYAQDIRDRDLPQETAQTHALHFAKGCYVGQEIVERIRSRGQVHRQLTPFLLRGTSPESLPAPLEAGGKAAGEITSVVTVSTTEGDELVALGYARREVLEAQTPLQYAGGTAQPRTAGAIG